MKHTVTEIFGNTVKALNDIDFPFNQDKGVDYIAFVNDHEPIRGPLPRTPIAAWLVAVEFRTSSETEPLFVTVSDETGQVLYAQHAAAIIEMAVNEAGVYYRKE